MYQAQITKTETGTPATAAIAHFMSHTLGGSGRAEAVDAEQGIWLIDVDDLTAARVEAHGDLVVRTQNGYTVEIEMP
jgi:hypothetical protein